jgi:hypothetical protein
MFLQTADVLRAWPVSESVSRRVEMFQVFFAVLAIVAASLHLAFSSKRRSSGATIAGTYLVYFFFIYVGLMGLLTAYAHVWRPGQTSGPLGGYQAHTNTKLAWPI